MKNFTFSLTRLKKKHTRQLKKLVLEITVSFALFLDTTKMFPFANIGITVYENL